jgi:DNA-binding PadR family transcriptional regulator
MPRAVSIRHLILGLLTQQPMSGYDIRRFLKSLSWLIESPSFGTIYPTLRALREDDLVTVEVISRQDKPPRKIYTITESGEQALREWIDQPLVPDASLKAFVMRLVLANSLSRTGLIAHLQQRRSQVATHFATLEQLAEATDGSDNAHHIAFDYSLALASAELVWLESALKQLSQQPLPMEVVEATAQL